MFVKFAQTYAPAVSYIFSYVISAAGERDINTVIQTLNQGSLQMMLLHFPFMNYPYSYYI